ncbi:hypothetical protein OTU49_011476 [Cherax quadricarinatus]|uniref:Uncharacterized protein n=1 Tax=Cherax quadricarinatus TaxID=27406 RepID=A0AAW0W2L1_CHEQU
MEVEKNQYNLRWNEHTFTFVRLLDHFRTKELYCDATIACDGNIYPVHKVVLSACSNFFAAIFANTNCQSPVVVLQDVARVQLESLLTYMYRGEVLVPRPDLPAFIKVAKSLQVKGLAIPVPDRYSPRQVNESPHNRVCSPIEGSVFTKSPDEPVSHIHHTSYRQEYLNPSLYCHKRFSDMMQPEPDLPRSHPQYDELPFKRRHLIEYSPNMRSESIRRMRPSEMGRPNDISICNEMARPNDMSVRSQMVRPNEMARAIDMVRPKEMPRPDEMQRPSEMTRPNEVMRINEKTRTNETVLINEMPRPCETRNDEVVMTRPSEISRSNGMESPNAMSKHQLAESNEMTTMEVETTQHLWSKESSRQNAQEDEHTRRKSSVSSSEGCAEEKLSPAPTFQVSGPHGTFQNLVASDDDIKDEPIDSPDEYEHSLCISEDAEEHHGDKDKFRLKTSDDNGYHSESSQSNRVTAEHQPEMDSQDPSSAESATLKDPSNSSDSVNSHLRRELLRPLQHKAKPPQNPQPKLQSIPHPVIAPREPERPRKEPPPLMKMPQLSPLMNAGEPGRPSHEVMEQERHESSSHSSHLLVKAPPTYRSHGAPNQFSLQVHNQQLWGPIIVNGGLPVTESSPGSQGNGTALPQADVPLNLTGQNKSRETEKDDKDPFFGKILTNRKKRLRGPKSWEYLVRLLKDPTTNPFLIRWENEASGVFRLVQPSIIAQRWGRRTGRHAGETLSYENFARGLRYHYATGALLPVSERSFVYRFGPKALKVLKECNMSTFPYI